MAGKLKTSRGLHPDPQPAAEWPTHGGRHYSVQICGREREEKENNLSTMKTGELEMHARVVRNSLM